MLDKQCIHTSYAQYSSDLITPVAAYLRLRDAFVGTVLLESSEYNSKQNSKSIIGINPIYELKEEHGVLWVSKNHQMLAQLDFAKKDIEERCIDFFESVAVEQCHPSLPNGFLGYQNFNVFSWAEGVNNIPAKPSVLIPQIRYAVYEFVLVFDHFTHQLVIIKNTFKDAPATKTIHEMYTFILSSVITENSIHYADEEQSDCTEEDFLEMIKKGKYHCHRGDVFQIVLSRHFSRKYTGDEFMLYRKLRSINPSPYLFYYDYTDYQLLGSSPEAQVIIEKGKAILNPIAGTYKRQGNDDIDFLNAKKLLQDEKENAEHTMLVDLARNDLSKFCNEVEIKSFKEIQMYSHVIHIVSKIVGTINQSIHPFSALLAVSPAGTLSGAPKHRAIQLINEYEKTDRSFYAGSVGVIGFDKSINQAITIRSCLLKDKTIHYRAGAGIVDASNVEMEVQEVYNKISAIRKCFDQ